tara:strand:+ start:98 stop:232 length:135 start_codon:yes stop_codon:yes gene_type:complete
MNDAGRAKIQIVGAGIRNQGYLCQPRSKINHVKYAVEKPSGKAG